MLIPKCCKGCSGRKSGICNCTLPLYCDEWVEDDETYPTNVGGVINTPNTAPSYIKIVDGTYPENEKDWAECPNCKEKDHRIAVLERALEQIIKLGVMPFETTENVKKYFIEQAEKELEEESK